jgi:hypothetical protein
MVPHHPRHYDTLSTPARVGSLRGSVDVWMATPSVLMTVSHGYLSTNLGTDVVRALDQATKDAGHFHFCADTLDLVNYERGYRLMFIDWIRVNRARILSGHVLLQNKIVYIGVSMVNLAARVDFHIYSSQESFDRKLLELGVKRYPRPASRHAS